MKISEKNRERISEQIISFLYHNSPRAFFTSHIAKEIVRDEEFVKSLLEMLLSKNLVVRVSKNSKGKPFKKRQRWKLSDIAYNAYSLHQ